MEVRVINWFDKFKWTLTDTLQNVKCTSDQVACQKFSIWIGDDAI